ncbi:MAG: hypothetical protein IIY21_12530, partial [Clostridiales bacterium]|nr:hypothetical protein [Clostridiales bacterium]
EVAKAYISIVPSMENSQKTIATEMGAVVEPASKEVGEKSGKHLGENIAKGLKTTSAVIAGAMATATASAIATGKAFINSAKDVAAYGDNVDKMSQKMGISAKTYQEWDYILKRSGSSIDSLKTSMKTLATASVEGNGAFKKIGITAKELKSMNQEELFEATIKGLQGVKDETLRMNLASRLLGRGATELGAVFNMTEGETESLRKRVHELNGVMSDEGVKDSANFQDQMLDMQTAMEGMKRNLMSQFLPSISAVMTGLSKLFSGDSTGIGMISSGIQSVIGKIARSTPQILSLVSSLVTSLTSAFLPMLPSVVSTIFSFINQAIVMVTGLVPQLTPVLTDGIKSICSALFSALPVLISALVDMAKELITWMASDDNTKAFVSGIMQLISIISDSLASSLEILLPALVNIIGQCADALTEPKNVQMILTSVLYIVGAVVMALVKALPEIGGVIVKSTANILTSLKNWGASLIGRIAPFLASVWQGIQSWFVSLPSKLSDAFKAGKDTILGWGKSAITWGSDMIKNFIDGIKKKAKDLGKAIQDLAKNYISKFLHFSVPDAGPLADADKWMPDFVDLMATGLEKSAPLMQSAVEDFAGGMSATITANGTNGTLLGGSTYNGGAVTINVYASEGQNVNDLANVIAQKLEAMTARKRAVYD